MVGRRDTLHPGTNNYIYVIGSDRLSSELHTINEEANAKYTKLELIINTTIEKILREFTIVLTIITLQKKESQRFSSSTESTRITTYQVIHQTKSNTMP